MARPLISPSILSADFARLVPSVRWLDPGEALRLQPLFKPEAVAGGAISGDRA